MNKSQSDSSPGEKFHPDFGYIAPKKKGKCHNPAFMDHSLHRCGIFKKFYSSEGLPGWFTTIKCVNCGRRFGDGMFYPGKREGISLD